mgnify:CR=1 FL=1
MDQAVWGILHGQPFLNSDTFNVAISRLGIHFDPILALFAPFYLVVPSVIWLILAQAVALPLASLPIYFLARSATQSQAAAFFWATAYLFSPFVLSAASWDFHPVSLAVPFIALAFLALERQSFRLLLMCCLVLLLCKEHLGLLVAGFGLLWLVRYREFTRSALLMLTGLGGFVLIMKALIRAFSPTGQHLMLYTDAGHISRYGWLGASLEEVFLKLLTQPVETMQHVLFGMDGWLYLLLLLLPLLFLPLIGFELLLPGMADLLANLLSSTPMPRSIFAYHSITLVPVLVVAAIHGSCRIHHCWRRASSELQAFAVVALTLALAWLFFPFFALPGGSGFWAPKQVLRFHDADYAVVRDLISPEMSVSVQANLGAHFTQRYEAYIYPEKVDDVDAVILRLNSPAVVQKKRGLASLSHHLQMEPYEYLASIRDLGERRKGDGVVGVDPGLIVFKKGGGAADIATISAKIKTLETEWR